ncbi:MULTISPECIES: LysE family translocator [unclassified Cryobacterium]|uniref:LysE family translocator n=1 Tax=unclassified Cryobacterium TaxID=2649013 RepID=UPI00106959F1|nr:MULTISPECIES: LysE family translocator [unclassified Cryobacterium]TFC54522.1 LysE family translocator [Cryobacterium sp. TMB3-1-2]TFC70896.1 LysE family translocator [Cryobacterium sp. TMB3-15]TFC77349.1 LysE family translocator [Cryobacterium sp. TMB3-10]TFD45282.1 LysE family translocator [Cryobacterium sp. TMB3-12]
MQTSTFLLFMAACLPLVLAPGPSVAFILTTTLSSGRRAGLSGVAGVELGYVAHVLAAVIGISAVIAASATAFTVVKVVGAAYLIWLGIQAWRSRTNTLLADLAAAGGRVQPAKAFQRGLLVGVLNPKTAVFFLSFLPPFVQEGAGPAWVQMSVLGLIFIAMASLPDLIWALTGSGVRRLQPGIKMKTMERFSGTVLFGLAAYSLTARRA